MKVVLFLSRFTLICNITFLLFVFFRWVEAGKLVKDVDNSIVIGLPFIKELIVILGFTAIIINLITIIIYFIFLLSGKLKRLPRWLVMTNVLFLLLQFYYFFLF